MSRQLVESILSKNMLEANDIFEAKLKDIREKKMYEMKRMMQAEVFGGLTPAEIEARKKAGYRKAADVLGDPRDKRKRKIPLPATGVKKKSDAPKISMSGEKRIAETVEVKPDPEGRVRGGEGKKSRGYKGLAFKLARVGVKAIKSVEKEKADKAKKSEKSETPKKEKKLIKKTAEKAADKAIKKQEKIKAEPETKKLGWVKRNVNTALGHEADYEKPESKGGRLGKAVNIAGRAAGRAVGSLARDLTDIGTSNLR